MEEEFELDILNNPEDEIDYVDYDIISYPSDFNLITLTDMFVNEDIIIPKFQRNFVWDIKAASKLIDSFLKGLPVPPIFLYVDEENKKGIIIDGQQRVRSISRFIKGTWSQSGKETEFRLKGFSPDNPNINKRYVDLTDDKRRKLDNSVLRAVNIRQVAPTGDRSSMYEIFERLNTGGVRLSNQEIRDCVYLGDFTDDLHELNDSKPWRALLGQRLPHRRKNDVELILRIFALSKHSGISYTGNLKKFLNQISAEQCSGTSVGWKKFKAGFPNCCTNMTEKLGEKPFYGERRFLVSLLDAVFCALVNHDGRLPDNFKEKFNQLKADGRFIASIREGTTRPQNIKYRIELASEMWG